MAHRVSEVNRLHAPTVQLKLVAHDKVEILLVDSVVRAEGGRIVIIDYGLVAMLRVITVEVA